jgi:hypothetical protein
MAEFTLVLQWEWIIGLGIPSLAAALGIIRYFWKKEKCFINMRNKINELSNHDGESSETHNDFDSRLKMLENDSIEIKIYLQQILTKLEIPFK